MPITNEMMAKRHEAVHKRRGRRITYKKFVSKDVSFATGDSGAAYTNRYVEHAIVWELTHETVIASDGRYKLRDKGCSILLAEMPETPPNKQSHIIIDSDEYVIIDWSKTGDNAKFTLILRKP